MARSIRIEYPGAYYHVMARGNLRAKIFYDDDDCRFFLQTVGEVCERTGWLIHAWVLMGNHYHLLVETPKGNLVAGMKWLQNTVTRRFNVRHRRWGRVFGDRYKAIVVEGGKADYYGTLWDYIHLNPVRAGLIRPKNKQSVADYAWSSLAGGYIHKEKNRAKWLAASKGLSILGVPDTVLGRRSLVERLDRRAIEEGGKSGVPPLPEEVDARLSHLRRGWYWGSREFSEKLLKLSEEVLKKGRSRSYKRSDERQSYDITQAEEWIEKGLEKVGLMKEELRKLKGNDVRKVALAKLVWEKTIVSQEWISQKLAMKSAANVSQILRRNGWQDLKKQLPPELKKYVEEI